MVKISNTNITVPINSASYIIYKDGTSIKAVNGTTGVVDYNSSDATTLIQKVIDSFSLPAGGVIGAFPSAGGKIEIKDGLFDITKGINVIPYLQIVLSPNTHFRVPQGYSSYVFGFNDNDCGVIISGGGYIYEDGSPTRQWIAIELKANIVGILFNTIRDLDIRDANTAVKLELIGNTGWINANSFQDIKVWRSNCVIDFISYNNNYGIHRNYFTNIMFQSWPNSLYGVRNIFGHQNTFIDVNLFDLSGMQISTNITNQSIGTIIIGGIMTASNFVDNGAKTIILDEFLGSMYIGKNNTGFGYASLSSDVQGSRSSAFGDSSLAANKGISNSAFGYKTLTTNDTGFENTATGSSAMGLNTIGYQNTATGHVSLYNNISGYNNVAYGMMSLYRNTVGFNNVSIGFRSGISNITGHDNIFIGNNADTVAQLNNAIAIGSGALVSANNSWIVGKIGTKQVIAEGNNAAMGVTNLVAGIVTVNNTLVTANSRIFLTIQSPVGVVGTPYISARVVGKSFTITSTSGTDASTVAWEIKEPA